MLDMIPVALRVDCLSYKNTSDRRHNVERREKHRLQNERRMGERRVQNRNHYSYNEIESQLVSCGAKHIQCYFAFDDVIKVNCNLPLDKLDEVKYIRGVEVVG